MLKKQMAAEFIQVTSVDDLNKVFDRSSDGPVILYNHDPYCPISARALGEMQKVDNDIALVDVSRDKTLTREIAERTGIQHESPQVIILKDGHSAWNASHFAITADAVTQATTAK
jgi:bacillithiol system protein YtxJ